jgi:3-dehydroquinate dehydratase-1
MIVPAMTSLVEPPLVVATVRPERLAALGALPRDERAPDIIEARLDLAAAGEPAMLPDLRPFFSPCRQIEESGSPVLATIRLVADGGRWTVDAERLPWFDEALTVASWVDIEVDSKIAADVINRAHARGRRAIVSHHDFAGTPEIGTLNEIIGRARALGADIVKIATLVETLDDHDRLVGLLREQRSASAPDLALVGMGPVGTPLRSYLPCVGSRLTYGYLDQIAAPGQIHAWDLCQRLIIDCPVYAEYRLRQGVGKARG